MFGAFITTFDSTPFMHQEYIREIICTPVFSNLIYIEKDFVVIKYSYTRSTNELLQHEIINLGSVKMWLSMILYGTFNSPSF